jgi:hypothetical protein
MPDDLDSPDDDQQPDNSVIRTLREKAERTDAAETKAQQLERELTLHKAGLNDLSDKEIKALTAVHDGEWEPDALKATATELGFVKQPDGTDIPAPKVSPEELASMNRMAAASGGTPPPPPDLDSQIAAAQNPEELKAVLRAAGRLAEGD